MFWRIFWWIVLIWVIVYAANNPVAASAHVHGIWHLLFGSAGPQNGGSG